MLGCLVAMLVAGGAAIVLGDVGPQTQYGMGIGCMVALLLAGIFFLCAFAAAVWAEVLKRQSDIVAFREIVAFDKGIPADEARDDSAFGRKHPVASIVAKVCSGAIFGFVAMMVVTIIAKYIRDFIFYGLGQQCSCRASARAVLIACSSSARNAAAFLEACEACWYSDAVIGCSQLFSRVCAWLAFGASAFSIAASTFGGLCMACAEKSGIIGNHIEFRGVMHAVGAFQETCISQHFYRPSSAFWHREFALRFLFGVIHKRSKLDVIPDNRRVAGAGHT